MTMVTTVNISAKEPTWEEALKSFYRQLYGALKNTSAHSFMIVKTPPCHAELDRDGEAVFAMDFKFDLVESPDS